MRLPLLLLALPLLACDPAPTVTQTTIPGAQFLTFRCVDDDGTGAPLDGCGCTERVEDASGMVQFRQMGRVECDCLFYDTERQALIGVDRVAGTCAGESCTPERDAESGDLIPVSSGGIECVPARAGEVHGYVGTTGRGEVAVIDALVDPGDADPKRILDVDRTIPGITAVYIGDLISDVESHPDGDFVFTVNSSSGTLSIVDDDGASTARATVDLGAGALMDAAVWPPIGRPRPAGATPLAFVSAPRSGQVLALDLAVLAAVEGAAEAPDGLVTDSFTLPDDATPGRLAVHPDGTVLMVAHARTPQITLIDLTGATPPRTVSLSRRQPCPDGYLERLVDPEDDVTCADGLDNDGDGAIDLADAKCTGDARSEAADPRCVKLSQCVDGIDNDGDGLVDSDDPDCAGDCAGDACPSLAAQLDWEGPVPACADGLDNDGDGLIDRLDPGCADEGDTVEADAVELKGTPACANGEDDDGDGLIDDLDPGCTDDDAALRYRFEAVAQCSDGADNDGDGLIDADDPQCWGAADTSEGADALTTGPTQLLAMRIDFGTVSRVFAYVVDGAGNLQWIDLDDPALPVRRINLGRVTPLAIAGRQIGQTSSLLMVGSDTALRSIEISAPTPLRTQGGRNVFARLNPDRTASDGSRLFFTDFYVVDDGVAYAIDGLDEYLDDSTDEAGYPASSPVYIDRADPVVPFELPADPAERRPLALVDTTGRYASFDRGRLDPMLFAAPTTRTLLHAEANVVQTAQGRTNRLLGPPRFTYGSAPVQFDPARNPTLCQLPQPDPDAPGGVRALATCVPVGYTANGQVEARIETDDRTAFRTDLSEAVQVIEDRVDRVVPGTYTLAYQPDLPDTTSRTGQFAGRESDEAWTMVDYSVDFCRRGVEVGDVVLIDVFVPAPLAPGEILPAACEALKPENRPGDPLLLREPVRYRIAGVKARQLELVRDVPDPDALPQLTRDERATPLGYFEPPPAPIEACAAQFIAYHIRAGNDDWLLTGPAGYRHPWVNRGGECVQSDSRLAEGRISRVQLDEPFENEWFRLHVGAWRASECTADSQCGDGASCIDFQCVMAPCSAEADACPSGSTCDVEAGRCVQPDRAPIADNGVPPDRRPHLLDARFEFDVQTGLLNRRLIDYAVLPGDLRWLPNDDRAYVVDTAFQTVVEAAGLDVYRQVMAIVRRFQ